MRRTTALLTGALALLVTLELALARDVAGYGVVLVGTVVIGTGLAAARLWGAAACTAEVRMATGLFAGLILAGQVLASWLGGPGLTPAEWTETAVAVVVLAAAVLLLVASTAVASQRPQGRRHPYAL